MKTGVVIDRRYMDHDMGAFHIESPARVEALLRLMEPEPPLPIRRIAPRPATDEELGWVHERGYIDLVRSTAGKTVPMDADTVAGPETWETALLAAGGFLLRPLPGRIQRAALLLALLDEPDRAVACGGLRARALVGERA